MWIFALLGHGLCNLMDDYVDHKPYYRMKCWSYGYVPKISGNSAFLQIPCPVNVCGLLYFLCVVKVSFAWILLKELVIEEHGAFFVACVRDIVVFKFVCFFWFGPWWPNVKESKSAGCCDMYNIVVILGCGSFCNCCTVQSLFNCWMTLHNLVLHLIVWAYLGLSACKIFCFFRHLGLSCVLVALKFGTLSSMHTASVILLLIATVLLFQRRFLGFCLKQAVHISSFSPEHENPTRSGWLLGFDDVAPLQHCTCFRWPANEYGFSSWRFTISLLTLLIRHGHTRAFSRGMYSRFLLIRLRLIWFFG